MISSISSQKPRVPKLSDLQASIKSTPAETLHSRVTKWADAVIDREEASFQHTAPNASMLQTPGPESGVVQTSNIPSKKLRPKTSHVHKYVSTRGSSFICNSCSKAYKINGGTGAIARHLKLKHSIDPKAGGLAGIKRTRDIDPTLSGLSGAKRTRDVDPPASGLAGAKISQERTAMDEAIIRVAEIRSREEGKRREELMGIGLDKDTLVYLCLRWMRSMDIPLEFIEDLHFRNFLHYVNPVANQLLPKSAATLKIYAETLFADEEKSLPKDVL